MVKDLFPTYCLGSHWISRLFEVGLFLYENLSSLHTRTVLDNTDIFAILYKCIWKPVWTFLEEDRTGRTKKGASMPTKRGKAEASEYGALLLKMDIQGNYTVVTPSELS